MVKVIPAHIENGQVVPNEPLPDTSAIAHVSVVLNLKPTAQNQSTLADLRGILKGKVTESDEDLKREYVEHLARKYR